MMDFVFNGVAASQMGVRLLGIKQTLFPVLRDKYETVPGRAGSYLFAQPFGDRKIELECALVSQTANDFWQDVRRVAGWLSVNKKAQLVLSKEPDKYYMAKVSNSAELETFLHFGKFKLEFACDPVAYSTEETAQQFVATPGVANGIYNNGTAETYPVITIIAAYGDIVSPKLQINDEMILFNGTITNGSQLDLNAENFTAYKGMDRDLMTTGAYDSVEDSMLAKIDGEFPELKPGPNSLIFSCENSVAADLKIQFRERWI